MKDLDIDVRLMYSQSGTPAVLLLPPAQPAAHCWFVTSEVLPQSQHVLVELLKLHL